MLISSHIDPRTRIAFLHIPKTAGSSLLTYFSEAFGEQSVWWHGKNFDISRLTSDIPDDVRLIAGHFPISALDHLSRDDVNCISVVRDPVDRIVSYHQFIIGLPSHPLHSDLPHREINADLESSEAFRTHLRNQQVAYLSWDRTAASARRRVERGALSIATINELELFVQEIAGRMGISCSGLARLNVGPVSKPILTTRSKQIVNEITSEDRRLFDYVHQFERQTRIVCLDDAASRNAEPMTLDRTALEERIASLKWYHQIDFGGGLLTPGKAQIDVLRKQAEIYFRIGLKGKSVLDIGCWDGFNSFEAARLGADRVLATDHFVWKENLWGMRDSFELARAYLAPEVEVMDIDIPDLTPDIIGRFDIVLFCGVLYHMRHPFHVLERIASLVNETLIVETHMDALDETRPAMIFYANAELGNDPFNWWGPNVACVTAMLNDIGFQRVEFTPHPVHATRGIFHAHRI